MRLGHFRRQAVLVVVLMLLAGESARFNAPAHQGEQPQFKCPVLKVTCPDLVKAGASLAFEVQLGGGDPKANLTFNWTVSNGALSSGQGTPRVELDTTELSDGDSVTATVEVGGLSPECSRTASCTASVMKKPEARKFDEYAMLKPTEEEARLHKFAMELLSEPTMQGYIITYGATSRGGEKAADKAKDFLVNKRSIDPSRLVTVAGGSREQATVELWIVPSGAEPPKATPTVDPPRPKPTTPAKPKKP